MWSLSPGHYPGLLLDPDGAGRVRYVVRQRPGPVFVVTTLVVLAALHVAFALWTGPTGLIVPAGLDLFVIALVLASMTDRLQVCDNALLVGTSLRQKAPYVVPWGTLDIGSVRCHRRAHFIARRLQVNGERSLRALPWTGKAVSFRALDPSLALQRTREGALDTLAYRTSWEASQAQPPPLPMTTWVVFTRRPGDFLAAVEEALADAGHDADRLAARVLAHPVWERWPTPLTEEQVYGPLRRAEHEGGDSE